MVTTFAASPRLTHGYRDGWDHLDTWGEELRFKLLGAGRVTRAPVGYDDGGTVLYHVVGSKRADSQTQIRALYSTFGGSQCRHEHDCCGCASISARVRQVRPGLFTVHCRTSYNY